MWGNQAKVGARRCIAFPHTSARQTHTPSISLAAHLTYATAGLLPPHSSCADCVCPVFQVKQLYIFYAFALGKAAGFASTPRPDPKTCGSCQLYYDLEMGLKEWGSDFKETSDALYAVLETNPLWPFDKPVSSGRWGCSCERDGFRPMWLAASGLCFWFDQQKNQDELLRVMTT